MRRRSFLTISACASLARSEGQVALGKLFERDVALASGGLVYRDNLVLRGLRDLPVVIRA